ncbi:MAG TPA: hypothetical protein VGE40_01920 [Bacilli bacterium]
MACRKTSKVDYHHEENFYSRFPIKAHIDKLKQGTNTIAVKVYRSHPKAPNMLFDLNLSEFTKDDGISFNPKKNQLRKVDIYVPDALDGKSGVFSW